jgi:peptide/nickel transport system substrate-binding protein/oligopeptide transport system substrate-binding protein
MTHGGKAMKCSPLTLTALAMLILATAQTGAQDAGSTRELVVGMGRYDVELNPYKSIYAHEMQLFTGLYEGLFSYDPQSLEPVRAQAESFEKSADGKTWTFHIREDARWSDGSSVTATDYVESWLYLLAPATKAEYSVFFDIIKGAKSYRNGKNKKTDSVGLQALGERTLVVELETPAAYFTRLLCHSSFVPVHRSLRGVRTWKPGQVIGNGPYTLSSMDEASMIMTRSETYWDVENVAIPAIRILFLETEAEATGGFNDGVIDWLTDMIDLDTLISEEAIHFSPMFATGYYFFNSSRKPWNDARIRRALTLLVPWEKIRTEDSYYAPTDVLILPFAGYESPGGISAQDEEEALKLLKDAGYPNGKGLPTVKHVSYASETGDANLAILQEAWEKIGITVENIIVPDDETIRDIRQDGFTISFTSWIGDFADPVAFLLMWTSDSGLNESGYKSKEFDALIARSMSEDGKARIATLAEAEEKLLSDAPLIPLYHSISFNVIELESILGWYENPLDIHPFKTLRYGTPKARPYVAMTERLTQ